MPGNEEDELNTKFGKPDESFGIIQELENEFGKDVEPLEKIESSDLARKIKATIGNTTGDEYELTIKRLDEINKKIAKDYNKSDFYITSLENGLKEGIAFAKELELNNFEKARLYLTRIIGGENAFERLMNRVKDNKTRNDDVNLNDLVKQNIREQALKQREVLQSYISDYDTSAKIARERTNNLYKTISMIESYLPKAKEEIKVIETEQEKRQKQLTKCLNDPNASKYVGFLTSKLLGIENKLIDKKEEIERTTGGLESYAKMLGVYESELAKINEHRQKLVKRDIYFDQLIQIYDLKATKLPVANLKNFVDFMKQDKKVQKDLTEMMGLLDEEEKLVFNEVDGMLGNFNYAEPEINVEKYDKINASDSIQKTITNAEAQLSKIRERNLGAYKLNVDE